MSNGPFAWIGRLTGHYPRAALCVILLLTLLAGWTAQRNLHVEMDVTTLLPKDSEAVQKTREAEWDFGKHDYMFAVLDVKKTAPAEVLQNPSAFLKSVSPEIESALQDEIYFRPMQQRLFTPVDDPDATVRTVSRMMDDEFQRIENAVSPNQIDASLKKISRAIADNATSTTIAALREDPLGLEASLSGRSQWLGGPLRSTDPAGYHISEDGATMLLVLWPAESSTDLGAAREMKEFLGATRDGLYIRNPEWKESVDIRFLGAAVANAEGEADVRQDVFLACAVSFLSVILLFLIAFRQPEGLIFVTFPLIIGIIWTLGLTSLMVTRLTQVTLTFTAIMVGLGIDFSIHLYNRYLEGVRLGRPPEVALNDAVRRTGPSIMAGAIVSGCAFFAMRLTRFEGFRDLGLFGGVGVLCCLLAVAAALPPLMVLLGGLSKQARGPMATFGLKKVTFTVNAYPRMTVAAGLCVMAYLALYAPKAEFDENFSVISEPTEGYRRLAAQVKEKFKLPDSPLLVIEEATTLEQALNANDQIYQNVETMSGPQKIVSVDSLRAIFPSPRTQSVNLRRLANLPLGRISARIADEEARPNGLPKGFLADYEKRLQQLVVRCAAVADSAVPLITLDAAGPHREIIQRYISRDSKTNNYRILTRIYPAIDSWSSGIPPTFQEGLSRGITNPPAIIGHAYLLAELKRFVISDLTRIILVVLACALACLLIYFKSVKRTLLALIPVFFALIGMLGMMALLGMQFNYLNIIALPMILGIGLDSGIHFLARYYEEGSPKDEYGKQKSMREAVEKTGRAIVLTSLTTIFGFGSLCVANFAGIRDIGFLAITGIVCALIATLLFLPAVVRLLDPELTFRGGPGDEIG
ncbi:MMPL family transporter [soil metagenome]